jgi:diguanylate cyclase (GGDEF)-like protein/PAS domain S-box-containing protein
MGTTADGATGALERAPRLSRDRLLDPVHLVFLPALAMTLAARHFGYIAPEAAWKIAGSLILAHVCTTMFAARFTPGTSRARPRQFLALAIGLGGLYLYVIGWGAILAVVFVAASVVVIQTDGARYGYTALITSVVTILIGETAVALGIFKSMIPEPTGHGIAVFEAAGTAVVIWLLTRGQREKEIAEERERQSEERFRALVQYASDAIVVIGGDGTVTYASPAAEHLLGCAPDELDRFDINWVDPDHSDAIVDVFQRLQSRPGAVASAEVPIRRADGTSRWVEVHFTNLLDNPAVGGYICNMRDIGERHVAQQQLEHDAQHDPVTHLPNRRLFLERLDRAWREPVPDNSIAVLFIDVDHFKHINDRLGHAAGDQVLVAVANKLASLVRPNDVVARFGGDEFTVLLNGVGGVESAVEIADRITRALSGPWQILDSELTLSVSVGISTRSNAVTGPEELLRNADEAMYRAKRNGRARCESYEARSRDLQPALQQRSAQHRVEVAQPEDQ